MVETVARAMVKALEEGGSYVDTQGGLDESFHDGRIDFLALSAAALKAIREPTEGMIDAAVHAFSGHNSLESTSKRMRKVVTAAIDAALTEEKGQ